MESAQKNGLESLLKMRLIRMLGRPRQLQYHWLQSWMTMMWSLMGCSLQESRQILTYSVSQWFALNRNLPPIVIISLCYKNVHRINARKYSSRIFCMFSEVYDYSDSKSVLTLSCFGWYIFWHLGSLWFLICKSSITWINNNIVVETKQYTHAWMYTLVILSHIWSKGGGRGSGVRAALMASTWHILS